ncbi:MAG TPA: hypothetical protein VIY71_01390, partial [Solirubrobacterales bacterium]
QALSDQAGKFVDTSIRLAGRTPVRLLELLKQHRYVSYAFVGGIAILGIVSWPVRLVVVGAGLFAIKYWGLDAQANRGISEMQNGYLNSRNLNPQ